MSARSSKEVAKDTAALFEPDVSVEDLRRKAEQVRDLAKAEVKRITSDELTRTITIAAVAVVAAVSLAYYLGSRRR